MIKARHHPSPFTEAFLHQWLADCREDWMCELDQILDDEELVTLVYEALSRSHPRSRTRGRPGTPAEVVLRMVALKHIFNWSFEDVEREVNGSLLYRQLTRVGAGKTPDEKTLARQELSLGPEVIARIHGRLVAIAHECKIAIGHKMRVDTTVVKTNIHHPTDSSLPLNQLQLLDSVETCTTLCVPA